MLRGAGRVRPNRKTYLVSSRCSSIRGSGGFQTSRLAAVSAATLALLVLVTVLPATHFLPTASIGATGGGHGPPTSEIQPLPAYANRQVVPIEYTSHRH